jgi:signal transduction histidine kinase/CheY-like chemotaxis protein
MTKINHICIVPEFQSAGINIPNSELYVHFPGCTFEHFETLLRLDEFLQNNTTDLLIFTRATFDAPLSDTASQLLENHQFAYLVVVDSLDSDSRPKYNFDVVSRSDMQSPLFGSYVQMVVKSSKPDEAPTNVNDIAEANVRAVEMMIELEDARDSAQRANIKLLEVNRHKSNFLSSMSHELRTPLNAIIGFTDLLQGEKFGILNGKQQQYVKNIIASSDHLLGLISDLLDIAKIDSGSAEMSLGNCSTEECIDGVVSLLDPQFQKAGLTVEVKIEKNLDFVFADKRKLKQIMMNLLSNAIKYTPKKGLIQVSLQSQENDSVLISVQDSGCGIPPEQQEVIFSEFHQADHNRDEGLDGIGLGLALIRRLVELHGGQIGVESEIDKGSTFWFTLPVISGEEAEPLFVEADVILAIPENLRVLIADDILVNLDMLTDMLSLKDYSLAIARNGEQAIDMTCSFKPDIILMDIRMPVMNGLEATRAIRAMPEFFDLPIIALTASAGADNEEKCFEAGCTAHLPKPVTSQSLFAAIDRVLNG